MSPHERVVTAAGAVLTSAHMLTNAVKEGADMKEILVLVVDVGVAVNEHAAAMAERMVEIKSQLQEAACDTSNTSSVT